MRITPGRSAAFVDLHQVPIAEARLVLAMRRVPRDQIKTLLQSGGDVPPRVAKAPGSDVVARFMCLQPGQPGDSVAFGECYDRFVQWLPAASRGRWCRRKFGQALPFDYVSLPGTANQKFIHRLAEPLAAPLASAEPSLDLHWSVDVGTHQTASRGQWI